MFVFVPRVAVASEYKLLIFSLSHLVLYIVGKRLYKYWVLSQTLIHFKGIILLLAIELGLINT